MVKNLETFPCMGEVEPLLAYRPEEWRSLVVHECTKVVYLVGAESINIAALWDTRRRPERLGRYIDRLAVTDPTVLNEPQGVYGK